jgi:hypothetical protein
MKNLNCEDTDCKYNIEATCTAAQVNLKIVYGTLTCDTVISKHSAINENRKEREKIRKSLIGKKK